MTAPTSLTIGITGAGGFVGSAVRAAAEGAGHSVRPVSVLRLEVGADEVTRFLRLQTGHRIGGFAAMAHGMAGCDVVVHTAGMARPESGSNARLSGANAALPGLVAEAAATAGVRRLVHVSTAAVQGSLDPLDETMRFAPLSPYAESKAAGELALGEAADRPPETVIFRPTSVQGHGRATTIRLCRAMSRWWTPLFGDGEAPLPLALIENVAGAVVVLSEAERVPPVALYPWEGLTFAGLLQLVGGRRHVRMPEVVGQGLVTALLTTGRTWPKATALGRQLELLVRGQHQEAHALAALGFRPLVGHEGYRGLCAGP